MALDRAQPPPDISRLSDLGQSVIKDSNLALASVAQESFFVFRIELSTIRWLNKQQEKHDYSTFFKVLRPIGQVLTLTTSSGTIKFTTTTYSSLSVVRCTAHIATTLIPRLQTHAWRPMGFLFDAVASAPSAVFAFPRLNKVKYLILLLLNAMADVSRTIKRRWRMAWNARWKRDPTLPNSSLAWCRRLNVISSVSVRLN